MLLYAGIVSIHAVSASIRRLDQDIDRRFLVAPVGCRRMEAVHRCTSVAR